MRSISMCIINEHRTTLAGRKTLEYIVNMSRIRQLSFVALSTMTSLSCVQYRCTELSGGHEATCLGARAAAVDSQVPERLGINDKNDRKRRKLRVKQRECWDGRTALNESPRRSRRVFRRAAILLSLTKKRCSLCLHMHDTRLQTFIYSVYY